MSGSETDDDIITFCRTIPECPMTVLNEYQGERRRSPDI